LLSEPSLLTGLTSRLPSPKSYGASAEYSLVSVLRDLLLADWKLSLLDPSPGAESEREARKREAIDFESGRREANGFELGRGEANGCEAGRCETEGFEADGRAAGGREGIGSEESEGEGNARDRAELLPSPPRSPIHRT